jgi:hypothetical protein
MVLNKENTSFLLPILSLQTNLPLKSDLGYSNNLSGLFDILGCFDMKKISLRFDSLKYNLWFFYRKNLFIFIEIPKTEKYVKMKKNYKQLIL